MFDSMFNLSTLPTVPTGRKPMFKYTLTKDGSRRCRNDEFYLQETDDYRGYTEKIFRTLHTSPRPLTVREIKELTGIQTKSINGVICYNIIAGYIRRITI